MNFVLNIDIDDTVPDAHLWERMRLIRNGLLAESDWTQSADAPVDSAAWADYRQALRDFPESWAVGPVAVFPEPPS